MNRWKRIFIADPKPAELRIRACDGKPDEGGETGDDRRQTDQKSGVDDRPHGFRHQSFGTLAVGARGGAVFSLVMGLTALTYFVAEATIMAAAVHGALPDLSINMILLSLTLLLVPILWFGMVILGRVEAFALVAYVILLRRRDFLGAEDQHGRLARIRFGPPRLLRNEIVGGDRHHE